MHTVHIQHRFHLSVGTIFRAWSEPDLLARWAWGSLGRSVRAEVDFRVGGSYKVETERPDGARWSFSGVYAEIEADRLIAHTLAWDAPVGYPPVPEAAVVRFAEDGSGCLIDFEHTGVPDAESAEGHRKGWLNTFETLEQALRKPQDVRLRDVMDDDLPLFFEHQQDLDANYRAAFTAKDPSDREAFNKHWAKIRADKAVILKTIIADRQVAGSVSKFEHDGKPEVCYWLGKQHWGRGIATRALSQLLELVTARPLYAAAAKDNAASIRVLEKCGFTHCGEGKGPSNARGVEVEEVFLELN
jgi:RimJ/RimL family protein N-acetyltransferase